MTHYSVSSAKRIFVKGYEFLCFTKKKGKNIGKKISKSWNCKYNQKLLDNAKQSATGAFKTSSRKVIQKTAEATSDLIGNKIADKIIRASKTSPKNNLQTNEEILREKRIFQELRQKVIDYLKLKED